MKRGKRIALKNGRKLVTDVVQIAAKMPLAPLMQQVDLSVLSILKKRVRPRITWTSIMMRAYALTAMHFPELRQMYTAFPAPHFYEHFENVCMTTITREYKNETRLFFARFNRPEEFSIKQIQEKYEEYRRSPIDEIGQFRSQVRFAKLPAFVRKPIWWFLINLFPNKKASHIGTYGMSLSGYRETKGVFHLGPTTTTLGYELFPKNGNMRITITFDHRVIDGKPATEIMDKLVEILKGRIANELRSLVKASPRVFAASERVKIEQEHSEQAKSANAFDQKSIDRFKQPETVATIA